MTFCCNGSAVAAIIAPNACLCGAESAAGKVKGTPVVRS